MGPATCSWGLSLTSIGRVAYLHMREERWQRRLGEDLKKVERARIAATLIFHVSSRAARRVRSRLSVSQVRAFFRVRARVFCARVRRRSTRREILLRIRFFGGRKRRIFSIFRC